MKRLTMLIDSHLLDNGKLDKEYSLTNKMEFNEFSCMDIPNAVYNKLGELEDVLEKYGIDNLEDFIKEYSSRNIKLANDNYDLEQELAELKQKAIMPKFKVGQEVWWINSFNEPRYRIESYLIDSIVITNEQFRYYGDDGLWFGDNELFATKEEAEQKLAEIKGKKDE